MICFDGCECDILIVSMEIETRSSGFSSGKEMRREKDISWEIL
jgi:hypothetical protein